MKDYNLYINGQFIKTQAKQAVINPCNEEVITQVGVASSKDVDLAIVSARAAFDNGPWPKLSLAERKDLLLKIHQGILDNAGHVIVDASTGLPTKSDTISVLGNATAKHKLGLDGTIKYKQFSLSFVFEYRGGYQIFNSIGSEMDWSGTGWRTAIYDRQRFVFPNSVIADPANPGKYVKNTNVEIANGNGNNGFWTDGINRDVTSNYVTSADFWKLRELSLSYNVPASYLAKTKFIKGCTVSVQGRNLFVWLAKDNYYTDPEYSSAGNTSNGIGLTGYQTPPSRYYGATVSFKF